MALASGIGRADIMACDGAVCVDGLTWTGWRMERDGRHVPRPRNHFDCPHSITHHLGFFGRQSKTERDEHGINTDMGIGVLWARRACSPITSRTFRISEGCNQSLESPFHWKMKEGPTRGSRLLACRCGRLVPDP